jgi:DNA-binding winged helix-turn-helix (wHTH) protein
MAADTQVLESDTTLSPLARRLVDVLARAEGRVVSRAELIDALWAGNHLVGEPALNRLVSEARRTLRKQGPDPIETVQRSGYRWAAAARPARFEAGSQTAIGPARYLAWGLGFGAAVVLVVLLGLLLDQLQGVIWMARHG